MTISSMGFRVCAAVVLIAADHRVAHADAFSETGLHADISLPGSLLDSEAGPNRSKRIAERKHAYQAGHSFGPQRVSPKHAYRGSAHSQLHLVKDDELATTTTDASVTDSTPTDTTTTSTATVPPATTAGNWQTGDWGVCHANCGSGPQFRTVTCVSSTGSALDASQCDASTRPTTTQSCEGDCISCDANARFLKGMGVSAVPSLPVTAPADKSMSLCAVQNSTFTCCPTAAEQQIQVSYSQMRRSLKSQTSHRDVSIQRVADLYTNITDLINTRIVAASDASTAIYTAMDNAPVVTASSDQSSTQLQSLRSSLAQVLDDRVEALQIALSDLSSAQDEITQQLNLMDSSASDLEEEGANDPASFLDTMVSDTSAMFESMYTSLVSGFSSPATRAVEQAYFSDADVGASVGSFVQHRLTEKKMTRRIHFDQDVRGNGTQKKGNETSVASSLLESSKNNATSVNFTDPNVRIVSKSCETAIDSFYSGLACASCNPQFPITSLDRPNSPFVKLSPSTCTGLYSNCADSLVEAHGHLVTGIDALLNSHGNLISLAAQLQTVLDQVWAELRFDWLPGFSAFQLARPNITNMACIEDLAVFAPFVIRNSTDFCNGYFSYASPRAFVQRISVQLDRGVFALAKFATCDRCLHSVLMFLADVLGDSNKGSLRVSLPTSANGMLVSCGAGPVPVVSTEPQNATQMMSHMTPLERTSPRISFPQSPALQALSTYASPAASMDQWAESPPPQWNYRTLVDANNKTRPIEPTANSLIATQLSPDALAQLRVMNQNCTSHSECYDQDSPSGDKPWWFCAHPNVCTAQPGACTNETQLLFNTGPKCARGPCTNTLSAIDKQCPDNAVCPSGPNANPAGQPFFGEEFFAKFDSVMRIDDPLNATSVSGVCECAFDSNGNVKDDCAYARCLAYATMVEDRLTCTTALTTQCAAIKTANPQCANDATLSCFDKDTILTYPPANAGECPVSDIALASESKSASRILNVGYLGILITAMVVSW